MRSVFCSAGVALGLSALGAAPLCGAALNPYNYSSLGALELTTPGDYFVDTDAGTITGPGNTILFTSTAVTSAAEGDVRVFSFDSVFIGDGVTVRGFGSRPLAFLSRTTAFVQGTINVNGYDGINQRGGDAGPGGGGGGGGGNMDGIGVGLAGGGGGGPRSGGGGGGYSGLSIGGNSGIHLGGGIGQNGAGPAGGAHSTYSDATTVGGAGDGGGSRIELPPGPGGVTVISGTGGYNDQTGGASNPIVSSRPGGGGGGGATNVDNVMNIGFGGGGGFGGIGGWGTQAPTNYAPAGRPGATYGDLTVMLEGGSGGGGGGYGGSSGGGGGGGGAFELVAPDGILVEGAITADGGWGASVESFFLFSGGGSGGGIILHGNSIILAEGSRISADGGLGASEGGGGRILIEYGLDGSYINAAGPFSPSARGHWSSAIYGSADGVITIQQVAIVPEPASAGLCLLAAVAALGTRRRRV